MKLVLYGGGDPEDNEELNRHALTLVGKKEATMSFIPSCYFDGELDFALWVRSFQKMGLQKFLYFPIDIPQDEVLKKEVFSSDLIHLGGGNTYYFIKYLRKHKLMGELKQFVKRGGVLTGLSAGAIMMTPNIMTASYPTFDCDENEERVKNLKSLGLVRFEFFPHYRNSSRYEKELKRQSRLTELPIIAAPDGHGVVINDDELTFSGKCFVFHKGIKQSYQ